MAAFGLAAYLDRGYVCGARRSVRRFIMRSFVLFSALSVVGVILAAWAAMSQQGQPVIAQGVWDFYAIAWLVVNGMFGGIHGDPAWSLLPSIVIAVIGQNAVLWLLIRRLIRSREQRSRLRRLGIDDTER